MMARFSICDVYMPMHDDFAVCSDMSLVGGRSVTVNLAAISLCDSSATGDCPAAGTGISLYCHYN